MKNYLVLRLCKKVCQKLQALARVSNFRNVEKHRKIMKDVITSKFGYCPVVWMFHNRIHERALRIVYNGFSSTFEQLLQNSGSFTIHERNIQALAIELYKIINDISPDIMKQVLPSKDCNVYSSSFPFKSRNVHTVNIGTETISSIEPKIWHIIPTLIKDAATLNEFKRKIKQWKPDLCPCRLGKTYIAGVGFVDLTN